MSQDLMRLLCVVWETLVKKWSAEGAEKVDQLVDFCVWKMVRWLVSRKPPPFFKSPSMQLFLMQLWRQLEETPS